MTNPALRPKRRGSPAATIELVVGVVPATASHGRGGQYAGRFGTLLWSLDRKGSNFIVWLNGSILPWEAMSRAEFRRLFAALGGPATADGSEL